MWMAGFPGFSWSSWPILPEGAEAVIQAVAQTLLWGPMCCPMFFMSEVVKCTHDLSRSWLGVSDLAQKRASVFFFFQKLLLFQSTLPKRTHFSAVFRHVGEACHARPLHVERSHGMLWKGGASLEWWWMYRGSIPKRLYFRLVNCYNFQLDTVSLYGLVKVSDFISGTCATWGAAEMKWVVVQALKVASPFRAFKASNA